MRERERETGLRHIYDNIISVENLLISWQEFLRGKRKRKDVAVYSLRLMDNILALRHELIKKTYQHGPYFAFKINDPKPRDIHKAQVRDRLIHHAVCRILYPYFDRKFIFDSYSCRIGKGTHKAMNRFRYFARKVSHNNTRIAWILKCDIKKFFATINHEILKNILKKSIKDSYVLWILGQVIDSFHTKDSKGAGLPLGNLTSQLLINVYMNELDQFLKHTLKVRLYIRFADDFVILHKEKSYLVNLGPQISKFLQGHLKLQLHPNKISIKPLVLGIDFLGWIHFPYHRILRTATKKRMFRRLRQSRTDATIVSYLGLLSHGNTYKLIRKIREGFISQIDTVRLS